MLCMFSYDDIRIHCIGTTFYMAEAPAYDHLIKLLLVGDGMVGKSSLLSRYTDNVFSQVYMSTIGKKP